MNAPRPMPSYAAALILGAAGSQATRTAEVRSPATGAVVGTYALAETSHVQLAVASADAAFRKWSAVCAHEREAALRKATAFARTRADEIGRLMALEQGKPYAQSRAEVIGACDLIDYYAAEAVRVEGQVLATEKSDLRSLVVRQPVGVVAA